MTAETLRIYALNVDSDARHTNLTRARGESVEMPPLAEWLGVDDLDHREIELFPLDDLGDMPLSDYVTRAFDPDPAINATTANRLDALSGSVLLVPGRALQDTPRDSRELTEVAILTLAQADQTGALPKADLAPPPTLPEQEDRPPEKMRRITIVFLLTALALAGLVVLLGALG
ncbi:hypothetical protein roselon_00688 [Roseibacterium elongatum DSM 19469]|uniref:Aspartate carbamoyltransferase catalytic subunit n=1 Tax=Roseicyclus elongatus DSM 19469 TaxID=1294273 RepID=W8RZ21_9RHOB|nr:hypothetical protein [Roseibacterium elongatum]AHM03117.1 hypothetical protein roselon_00688 [Roseibacterium elongatum DSM 19469]